MRRFFLIAICVAVAAALVSTGMCWAQEGKFALVSLAALSQKSTKAKAIQNKLKQLMEAEKASLENKQKEYLSLKDDLQKQGGLLEPKVREDKIKKISALEVELKLAEQEAQNKLQNAQREAEDKFMRDVTAVISKIRAQKNLAAVFNSAALFSADNAMDITEEVVRAYDAESASSEPPKPTKPHATQPGPPKPKAPAR
jgi:outer membrane protein